MESSKSLTDAILANISGGRLLEGKAESIRLAAKVLRDDSGMTLEEAKHLFTMDYHRVPHLYSTNGSEEDLQDLLAGLEAAWYSE